MGDRKLLKILFWCPSFSIGGGHRLLNKLIETISSNENVREVVLVTYKKYLPLIKNLRHVNNINILLKTTCLKRMVGY